MMMYITAIIAYSFVSLPLPLSKSSPCNCAELCCIFPPESTCVSNLWLVFSFLGYCVYISTTSVDRSSLWIVAIAVSTVIKCEMCLSVLVYDRFFARLALSVCFCNIFVCVH
jgi:hypothetical protein